MFTGIIQAIGQIAQKQATGSDARLYVQTNNLDIKTVQLGDSIAVNGVCLTAVTLPGDGFWGTYRQWSCRWCRHRDSML